MKLFFSALLVNFFITVNLHAMTAEPAADTEVAVVVDMLPHEIWHDMIVRLSVRDRAAFQLVCKLFMRLFPLGNAIKTSDGEMDLAVARFLDEAELKRFNALRTILKQPLRLTTHKSPGRHYGSRTRLINVSDDKISVLTNLTSLDLEELEGVNNDVISALTNLTTLARFEGHLETHRRR